MIKRTLLLITSFMFMFTLIACSGGASTSTNTSEVATPEVDLSALRDGDIADFGDYQVKVSSSEATNEGVTVLVEVTADKDSNTTKFSYFAGYDDEGMMVFGESDSFPIEGSGKGTILYDDFNIVTVKYNHFSDEATWTLEIADLIAPILASQNAGNQDFTGRDAVEVKNELEGLGYTVTFLHANTKMDFTESLGIDGMPWIITKQDSPKDMKITLYIDTQENIANVAAADSARAALEAKLDPASAWTTAAAYGEQEYPYGFKLHYFMGKLAEEPYDENTWFLKAQCTVTNAFGTKAEMVAEFHVTGTSDNPVVTYCIVY